LKSEGKKIIVTYLEKFQAGGITIETGDKILDIKLKGFVDRIDKVGEEWKIIDYKSGTVNPSTLKFSGWDELRNDPDLSKVLQLYTYALLFRNERNDKNSKISAGVISLRKLNEGFMQVPSISSGDQNEFFIEADDLEAFTNILKEILGEIYDFNIPFKQTEDIKRCENCDFVNICTR
jgi:hypothetical protein